MGSSDLDLCNQESLVSDWTQPLSKFVCVYIGDIYAVLLPLFIFFMICCHFVLQVTRKKNGRDKKNIKVNLPAVREQVGFIPRVSCDIYYSRLSYLHVPFHYLSIKIIEFMYKNSL